MPKKQRKSSNTSASASPPNHEFTRGLYGWITHTDLASTNAAATRVMEGVTIALVRAPGGVLIGFSGP